MLDILLFLVLFYILGSACYVAEHLKQLYVVDQEIENHRKSTTKEFQRSRQLKRLTHRRFGRW